FGFAQEADDLLFGKTLLHVQSPWGRELDSKLRCYSKLGGRRARPRNVAKSIAATVEDYSEGS
ncbi:hypothetical protein, partial [Xanthomonas citri]|uniref:hypothetical protein n=1 Tax=Xanthomonas citri TaxID=346 RepID=UPI001D0387D3